VLDLGELARLDEGDFISAKAQTAGVIAVNLTGLEFSDAPGVVLSGIQDDGIGTTGATSVCAIGAGNNRYLFAALKVIVSGGFVGWSSYDTLSVACTDGAMTPLVHADYNYGSGPTGSIHLFGRANPSPLGNQTITPTVSKAGATLTPLVASMSKSGVGSVTGAASDAPTTSGALNLTVTSAVGHVPVMAAGLFEPPQRFNRRLRAFDGSASGFSVPNYLVLGDAPGASSVNFSTLNAMFRAAVGIDAVPA